MTLEFGTAKEVGEALRMLGAKPETIARGISSFDFRKVPGALVTRVENGFIIGGSFHPEAQSAVNLELGIVQSRLSGILAANDERFALAA